MLNKITSIKNVLFDNSTLHNICISDNLGKRKKMSMIQKEESLDF
jgi:hypothetical protein